MAPACAIDTARALTCRDTAAAMHLKLVSILVIFFTSVIGISAPVLLARYFKGKPSYDRATLIIKCFAAGVILSTSLVHVLPDAYDALADCRVASQRPWKNFPFAGLVTLIGVALALLVDITASAHVEQMHGGHGGGGSKKEYVPVGTQEKLEELKLEVTGGDEEEKSEDLVKMKQKLVSQVLEIGIISIR